MFKWLDPKAIIEAILWIIKGNDDKKGKRVLLLILVALLTPLASLEIYNIYSRAKWQSHNPNGYPMSAPAVK